MCNQQGEVLSGGKHHAPQDEHLTGQNKGAGEESDEPHRAAAPRYHRPTLQKPNQHTRWHARSRYVSFDGFYIIDQVPSETLLEGSVGSFEPIYTGGMNKLHHRCISMSHHFPSVTLFVCLICGCCMPTVSCLILLDVLDSCL